MALLCMVWTLILNEQNIYLALINSIVKNRWLRIHVLMYNNFHVELRVDGKVLGQAISFSKIRRLLSLRMILTASWAF